MAATVAANPDGDLRDAMTGVNSEGEIIVPDAAAVGFHDRQLRAHPKLQQAEIEMAGF